ncbi:hypothetical protein SUGI_0832200 [Cryptomeria japonica]|nr:hypothetical protein SUGI_0832200 [Cryptomeria japonica]
MPKIKCDPCVGQNWRSDATSVMVLVKSREGARRHEMSGAGKVIEVLIVIAILVELQFAAEEVERISEDVGKEKIQGSNLDIIHWCPPNKVRVMTRWVEFLGAVATAYAIESFNFILKTLWKEISFRSGNVLAIFLKAYVFYHTFNGCYVSKLLYKGSDGYLDS